MRLVIEILLIIACVGIVAGVVIKSAINKKRGKCSSCEYCNGDCPHCAHRQHEKK